MKRSYRYKEAVDFEENDQCEFKSLQGKSTAQMLTYIVDWAKKAANGFLNCRGGTVYFGIEDDGTITGVCLDRELRDDIQRRIGQMIGEFFPAVDPSRYKLSFSVVENLPPDLPELFIIELTVQEGDESVYWASSNSTEAYLRQTTSTVRMQPPMIQQRFLKGRIPDAPAVTSVYTKAELGKPTEAQVTSRTIGMGRNDVIIAARPSIEFECELPLAFRSGKGQIRFKSVPGRDLIVDLTETVILGSLMFGLKTPFDWLARPYLRKLDTDLFEVVIGQFSMTINEAESREFCECVDEICDVYRSSIIEAEDILETWKYPIITNENVFGFSLLQVDREMWRLMQRFSQEFDYGRGQSDWHIFEHQNVGILIRPRLDPNAWLWPVPEMEYLVQLMSDDYIRTETVNVVYAIEDVYLDYSSEEKSKRLAWRQHVGKLGVWTADQTRSWLKERFIPKVLEHYHNRRTPEQATWDSNQLGSLDEVHDIQHLDEKLLRIQMWLYLPRRKIAASLLVPYYEVLAELVTTASSPALSYGYISGNLRAADQTVEVPLNNVEHSSMSEIAATLRRHAERIRETGYEDSSNAEHISRAVIHVVEHGQIRLNQFHLNKLNSALKPLWKLCQFETRHVLPY